MQTLLIKVILSYLLGSVVGSLLVGRLRGGVDIRRLGSGNAGGTNALRTQGKAFAFWVMVIDIGKGWIATRWLPQLACARGGPESGLYGWVAAACGIAVIIGHVYPIWYGFRGGKGVATLVGAVSGPGSLVLVAHVGDLVVAVMSVRVCRVGVHAWGAGACRGCGAVALPGRVTPLLVFGVVAAVLIAFTHRSNIARMLAGTEPRAQRLWLFGSRSGGAVIGAAEERPLIARVFAELAGWAVPFGRGSCRSLGVSRSAVWKAVKSLRDLGATLHAVRNRGYRLGEVQ